LFLLSSSKLSEATAIADAVFFGHGSKIIDFGFTLDFLNSSATMKRCSLLHTAIGF
jgi:ABC-type multidrug transport system ATPase subunit